MNIAKIIVSLAGVAIAGYTHAASAVEPGIVELAPMIVEATRIADPYTAMRAKLDESRIQLAAPTRVAIQLSPRTYFAAAGDPAAAAAPGMKIWFVKQGPRARRLL